METISLCMITKNEEFFLENCLNNIKDFVDEIIIIDTGSIDQTKEIAKKFTSKIYDFIWCDDFSKARNESLKYATKEWILILDADESITKKDFAKIKTVMTSDECEGISFIHRNYINESSASGWVSSKNDIYTESKVASGWFPESVIRLFKNKKEIFFTGIVHESVQNSLIANKNKINHINVPIHHYGKLNYNKLKEKELFYEKLGKKKIKSENDNFYAHYELGRQYVNNKKYDEAITSFKKSIALNENYFESWFMLGTTYLLKQEFNKALKKLIKAQSLNPNYSSIYSNIGIIFTKKKDFKKAIDNFIKAIHINQNNASAYRNLGMCYHEIKEKEKAYLAFKKAIELNPEYKKIIKLN